MCNAREEWVGKNDKALGSIHGLNVHMFGVSVFTVQPEATTCDVEVHA